MIVECDIAAVMRDGVVLRADVYRPPDGVHPVLVARTPYGKRDPHTLSVLDPLAAVRRGFIVVVQDVRGRFRSGGDWAPLVHERDDGYDTIEWAARLPGTTGRVATFGPSYLGQVQLAAQEASPPSLVASAVAFTWSDPDDGLITRGGAAESGLLDQWTLTEGFTGRLPRFRTGAPIPTVLVAGWYDAFLQGTLDIYQDHFEATLIIGPWSHHSPLPSATSRLILDLVSVPTASRTDSSRINVGGFDGSALVFVTGADEWRRLDVWPPPTVDSTWCLLADGHLTVVSDTSPERSRAITRERSATPALATNVAAPASGSSDDTIQTAAAADGDGVIDVDPDSPVPTYGGALLLAVDFPPGPLDQWDIEARSDVLVYTSDRLRAAITVIGRVRAHLVTSTDAAQADWVVRLCDVDTDGVSRNLTDGIRRVGYAGCQPVEVTVDLWSVAHVFQAGHRIRVQVTWGSSPRWDTAATARTRQRVQHGWAYPSRIVLPIGEP